MKKLAIILGFCLFCCQAVFADDVVVDADETTTGDAVTTVAEQANQVVEMEDNKINVIVMKQPLNEKSNQVIRLRRNWLGVYIQINGKIKVNPLANTYEVQ